MKRKRWTRADEEKMHFWAAVRAMVPQPIPFSQAYLNAYFAEAARVGVPPIKVECWAPLGRCLNPQCYDLAGHTGDCCDIPF